MGAEPGGQRAVPDHKDRRCPSCGSAAVRAIVYGLVEDPATFVGQCVAFGRCCVAPNDPTRRCDVCGHEWGRVEGDTPTFRPYQLLSAVRPDEDNVRREDARTGERS